MSTSALQWVHFTAIIRTIIKQYHYQLFIREERRMKNTILFQMLRDETIVVDGTETKVLASIRLTQGRYNYLRLNRSMGGRNP